MDRTEQWLDAILAGKPLPEPRENEPVTLSKLRRVLAQQAERTDSLKGEALNAIAETLMRLATRDFNVHLEPSSSDDTVNAAFVGISMMAEELSHSQTELERARDAALAASRSKSTFLANMSHELRTPLNAIIGYCELLHDDASETTGAESMVQDLERVLTAAHHLLGLISDVLDLSKIEAGRMEFEIRDVALAEVVREIQTTLSQTAAAKELRLYTDFRAKPIVRGDSLRLKQVMLNLVGNAIKFTEEGEVRIEVTEEDETAVVSVYDTGPGISADRITEVFDPFIQAQRSSGGTGLGLAISRQLVRLMDGDLGARSTVGEGSVFIVRLPKSRSAPLRSTKNSTPRLLVVDDDPIFHDLVKRHLIGFQCEIFGAPNGRDALEKLPQIQPDLIILDIMMPTMDGWSTLTHLKGHPALAAIPVVMVSVMDRSSDARVLAASDYLVKPIQRKALVETVSRFMDPKGRRILIVDDDRDARELARRVVTKLGCVVTEAEDGIQALKAMREEPYDLVLLDLQMPRMDGFQTVAEIQSDPALEGTPVIVVTATSLDATARERLAGRVSHIVRKGRGRTALLNAVTSALSKV